MPPPLSPTLPSGWWSEQLAVLVLLELRQLADQQRCGAGHGYVRLSELAGADGGAGVRGQQARAGRTGFLRRLQ